MTRQHSPKISILGAAVLFLAVLIVLIAFAAPAPQAGTDQPSAKSSAAAVAQAITPVQGLFHSPLLGAVGSQSAAAARSQNKKAASAAPDSGSLSFLPAVTYSSDGTWLGSLVVADVNGDGKPDIIVGNAGGTATDTDNPGSGCANGGGAGSRTYLRGRSAVGTVCLSMADHQNGIMLVFLRMRGPDGSMLWNTFDTGGVCLACLHQCTSTQCLSCTRWSPHSDWYAQ